MTRVYVSGPMTGIADLNRPAFHAAAAHLRKEGFEVHNPADVIIDGADWTLYMRADINLLLQCDKVFVLRGWQKSKGARLEVAIAHQLGMPVLAYPEGIQLVEDIQIHIARTYDGLWLRDPATKGQ
jgi:hypothetical protein